MFLSSSTNAIDAKGRTSVPAGFREALGHEQSIYIWPSVHGDFLEGGGTAYMESLQREIFARVADGSLSPVNAEAQQMVLLGKARKLGYDKTGRIVLPQDFRDHAHLDGSATFVGLGNRFQVWNPDAHEARMMAASEKARATGPMLGAFGV
ncbi:division/cell wall cluster transcriptional repressor MraZ [Algimonas porphyrae]|uniref:Transcriptional regulator MraZ n=1 Tax=Algimonas porphyrae TaxID=1128113 RepID=A0ABQ5UXN1_9PROT|nr:division/cell wall cluster transcriptional repressor MraZ [Algimonas porphyrae]GLQ20059.1 transcriptional regulator MraZ [Algimonas porphyrae]